MGNNPIVGCRQELDRLGIKFCVSDFRQSQECVTVTPYCFAKIAPDTLPRRATHGQSA